MKWILVLFILISHSAYADTKKKTVFLDRWGRIDVCYSICAPYTLTQCQKICIDRWEEDETKSLNHCFDVCRKINQESEE